MLGLTPTWAIWSNGNTPKIWWNKGGVRSSKNLQYLTSPKRCKIGPKLLWRTNRKSHIRAFVWYQNQWPWTAETSLMQKIKKFYGAHQKNFNEDRPILSAANCRPMILVSRNMRIFAGFLGEKAWNTMLYLRPNFHLLSVKKIRVGIVWSSKFPARKNYTRAIFQDCLYRAHHAVIFVIAQLC